MRLLRWVSLAVLGISCGSRPPSATCTAAEQVCGDSCADVRSSNTHCGVCGNACPAGEACADAKCWPRECGTLTCAESQACVDGVCVDRACFGVMCAAAEACAGGTCHPRDCGAASCAANEVCVDNACVDASCVGVLCPAGLACTSGACVADTCTDGIQSGTESDSDCGGALCRACSTGQKCTAARDCDSLVCNPMGKCAAPTCTDNARNGEEGDVDCGGACPKCAEGRSCTTGPQCQSDACTAGRCTAALCSDMVKNGTETDRDCGGSCPPCADGKGCEAAADCSSTLCVQKLCVNAACVNNVKDGTESDVDCGLACVPCADGRLCNRAEDCASKVCSATNRCVAPTCTDGVWNGVETDSDCGGGGCAACGPGKKCKVAGDCASRSCQNGICFAPNCNDGIGNGFETDVDCGGASTCRRCETGQLCDAGSDCGSLICNLKKCDPPLLLWPPVARAAGTNPRGLSAADLDNDGLTDLVATNWGSNDVSLFYQTGDGGLAAAINLQVTTNGTFRPPTSTQIGDVTGDGIADLVIPRSTTVGTGYSSHGGCVVGFMKGLGNRLYQAATDSEWRAVASGCGLRSQLVRLNDDNKLDLIAGDGVDDIPWCCNGFVGPDLFGGYAFEFGTDGGMDYELPGVLLDLSGPFVAAGDVNGDGKADVVGHSPRLGQVRVYLGNGDGTFRTLPPFGVASGSGDVVLADFSGDGKLDLAVATDSVNTVGISLGVGDGTFTAPQSYSVATPYALAVSDIDGDGKGDLVVGSSGIAVFKGGGDGGFAAPNVMHTGLGRVYTLAVGDLNGDGKSDVAAISGGSVQVMYNAR